MIRLSRAQVREVDRIAIEEYGLPGIVLMENAARSAVDALEMRFGRATGKRILIACGPGNNGGDGLAMARLLHNRGCAVRVWYLADAMPDGDAGINWNVAHQMKLEIDWLVADTGVAQSVGDIHADLCIDALLGTGLSRQPRGDYARLIERLNQSARPILAVDLPSGLDCDSGEPLGDACIRADLTVTFVAEKLGFANPRSRGYTGDVVVADIGCPREIIQHVATT